MARMLSESTRFIDIILCLISARLLREISHLLADNKPKVVNIGLAAQFETFHAFVSVHLVVVRRLFGLE